MSEKWRVKSKRNCRHPKRKAQIRQINVKSKKNKTKFSLIFPTLVCGATIEWKLRLVFMTCHFFFQICIKIFVLSTCQCFKQKKQYQRVILQKWKLISNCSFFLKDVKYDEEGKIKKVEIIVFSICWSNNGRIKILKVNKGKDLPRRKQAVC